MSPADTKADCEARKAELICELELARLRRKDQEDAAANERQWQERQEQKEREKEERIARENTVRAWREEQVRKRQERRDARRRFFAGLAGWWRKRQESMQGQSGTLRVLAALGTPAVLALFIYALTQPSGKGKILAVGLLTATAAFSVGALLGFIFGIPRSVAGQQAKAKAASEGKDAEGAAVVAAAQYAPNTNLEEISDWLTKILVGVGLVQIHQVSGAIEDLANGLEPGLGSQGFTVAVALLISFAITGFVGAYLYTRLRLPSAFELATATFKQVISESANTQTAAIALIRKQLSPGGDDRPTVGELTKALKAATPGVRSQAFYMARDYRRKNSGLDSEEKHPDLVPLCVPVFQALIACDEEGHYHRTRAELGYALKDQEPPDFAAAKAALDEAIRLRPLADVPKTPLYEFNRAYCLIKLDPTAAGQASPDPVIEAVCTDIEVAIQTPKGQGAAAESKETGAWLSKNSQPADSPARARAATLLAILKQMKQQVPPAA